VNRRQVLSAAGALGLSAVGVSRGDRGVGTSASEATSLDGEIVDTVDMPADHARGMGHTRTQGTDYLCVSFATSEESAEFERGYYVQTDGTLSNSVVEGDDFSTGVTASGFDLSQSAIYVTRDSGVLRYSFDDQESVTGEVSATPYSLTYDDGRGSLFVGLGNGLIWEMDESLDRVATHDLSSSVYGLSHDGEGLWVGNQSSELLRYDPSRRTVVDRFDYPAGIDNVYDVTYFDGSVWFVGNETAYGTNVPGDTDPTPTRTPTDTPESTPSGTARLCVENGSLGADQTVTVPVVITDFDSAGGFAGIDVEIQFPTNVTPTDVTVSSDLGPSDSSIGGQTVAFRASDGRDAYGQSDSEIPLGTVTVRGAATGSGSVEPVEATVDDDSGQRVTLRLDRDCGQFTTVSGCPTVDGRDTSDPDGDGLCEDLNGNGRADFDDVNTFFDSFQSSDVRDNVSAFDFNENDRIDFDDVNTLFEEIG